MIVTKRVYEPSTSADGYRVLIDRPWPRGVSKTKAHLSAWWSCAVRHNTDRHGLCIIDCHTLGRPNVRFRRQNRR